MELRSSIGSKGWSSIEVFDLRLDRLVRPARFSPDDKYSRQRVLLKKRFGLLPTQKPGPKY